MWIPQLQGNYCYLQWNYIKSRGNYCLRFIEAADGICRKSIGLPVKIWKKQNWISESEIGRDGSSFTTSLQIEGDFTKIAENVTLEWLCDSEKYIGLHCSESL